MGVQKFRTFEDARRALWLEAGDPEILIRMRRLGELARGAERPHGVFRYRTIEEAKGDDGLGQRRPLP
jgi:hypothetical protein